MRSGSDLFVFSISFFWYQCCLKNQPLLRGGPQSKLDKRFVFNATPTKRKPIKLIEMECRFVGRIALCESGV